MTSEQIYEKHCAISLVEILGIGTGRRDLKTTILSAINEALEVGATKEAELQQRIKELEEQLANWKNVAHGGIGAVVKLQEQQGKFAEWASGEGWYYDTVDKVWRDDATATDKQTPELWAEWDSQSKP